MRSRRVLFVENRGDIVGGGQVSLLDLMSGLRTRPGWEPSCVCPDEGTMTDAVARSGIPVSVVPMPALRPWKLVAIVAAVWRLYSRLRRDESDVVHANGSRCMFFAGLAGRLARRPVVWHVRVAAGDGWWDRLLRALASRIVVNSRAVAGRFGRTSRVRLIYNGVALDRGAATSEEIVATRRELKVESGWLVGMVGRLTAEKDFETCLRALAVLGRKGVDVHCLLVGADPARGEPRRRQLLAQAAELGVAEIALFTGHRDDAAHIIGALDILVHCAHIEGFGRVLVEAMAAGVPVVATAVGGIPEVVADGETGILVAEGDHQAVAAAIQRLLEDVEARAAMGASGRLRAQRMFDLDAHVAAVAEVYEELCS